MHILLITSHTCTGLSMYTCVSQQLVLSQMGKQRPRVPSNSSHASDDVRPTYDAAASDAISPVIQLCSPANTNTLRRKENDDVTPTSLSCPWCQRDAAGGDAISGFGHPVQALSRP